MKNSVYYQSLKNQTIISGNLDELSLSNLTCDNVTVNSLLTIGGLVSGMPADNISIEYTANQLKIKANGVSGSMIQNNAVSTSKIEDYAISSIKLGTGAVINSKIEDLAISTGKIQDYSISSIKLGTGSVTNAKIVSVDGSKITGTLYNDIQTNSLIMLGTGPTISSVANTPITIMDSLFTNAGQPEINTTALYASDVSGTNVVGTNVSGEYGKFDYIEPYNNSTIRILDGHLEIQDNAFPLKIAKFQTGLLPDGVNSFEFPSDGAGILVTNNATQTITNKFLDDSTTFFSNSLDPTQRAFFDCSLITPAAPKLFYFPDQNGTLAVLSDLNGYITASSTDSLSNKSLQDSTTYFVDNTDATKRFQIQCSSISTGTVRTWWIPNSNDTFVGRDTTDILTNKNIVLPVISSIKPSAGATAISIPNVSGETFVLTGNAQTLTNKNIVLPATTTGTPSINFTPNGSFKTSPAEGDLEYNSITPYFTAEFGRAIMPTYLISYCSSANILTDNNTAQSCFAASKDSLALQTSSSYFVEWKYYITTGANSKTIAIGWTYSGSIVNFEWTAMIWSAAANTITTTQTTVQGTGIASKVLNAATLSVHHTVTGSGILVVSTAGNFVPQLTFSAATGSVPAMRTGSFCRVTPLCSGTLNSFGPWG
jgi:hypothetical protein